uniref:Uncharacterized protein n=1 Tax=Anguilla anguilla TaxID=7936 RepID=A0A0E9VXN5_ANGAN
MKILYQPAKATSHRLVTPSQIFNFPASTAPVY